MRPFGCPLTILNTLDPLGKFDGKSNKGYLLGYSTTSKAFRVYNKQTKIVEENLHIDFLEYQPNVQKYALIGTQESYVAGSSGKDKEPTQEQAFEEEKRKSASTKRAAQATSINKLNTGRSSVNTTNTPYVSAASTPTEADFNNMDNTINVSPITTLRVHKDHPKGQILGDPKSAIQTRGKIQKASSVQQALEEGIDYDEDLQPLPGIGGQLVFVDPAYQTKFMNVNKSLYGYTKPPKLGKRTFFFPAENGFRRATTPMSPNKPLVKDEDGVDVDVHIYRNNMDLRMDGSCASNFSHIWVMANLRYSDKHNMVAFLKKPNESVGFTEIVDFLKDVAGISNLPDAEIYDGLATLGFLQMILGITTENNGKYLAPTLTKKLFANIKRGYARDYVPLMPAMLAGATEDQGEGSAIPTEPQHTPTDPDTKIPQSQGPTFTHVADEATTTGVRVGTERATTTTSGLDAGLDSGNIHESPLRSYKAPLHEGHTSGSAEDNLQLKELMVLVPKLVTRIANLKTELHQIKTTYGKAVLTLVERVKSLEVALKRRTKKVVVSDSEDEETKNRGRKIQDIDDDLLVSLVRESMKEKDTDFVTLTKISASGEVQEQDINPTTLEAAKTLSQVISQKVKSTDKGIRYKRKTRSKSIEKDISTDLDAGIEVNSCMKI
ncbi:hypothetical protein Tco_1400643 [Tanacetum coccineum]